MVLFGNTHLALLCPWLIDRGVFLHFPFDWVLDFHISQPPNVPGQSCTFLKMQFRKKFNAVIFSKWLFFQNSLVISLATKSGKMLVDFFFLNFSLINIFNLLESYFLHMSLYLLTWLWTSYVTVVRLIASKQYGTNKCHKKWNSEGKQLMLLNCFIFCLWVMNHAVIVSEFSPRN